VRNIQAYLGYCVTPSNYGVDWRSDVVLPQGQGVFKMSLYSSWGQGSLMQLIASNLVPRSLTRKFFETPYIRRWKHGKGLDTWWRFLMSLVDRFSCIWLALNAEKVHVESPENITSPRLSRRERYRHKVLDWLSRQAPIQMMSSIKGHLVLDEPAFGIHIGFPIVDASSDGWMWKYCKHVVKIR
jgi:hypothetical protein